MKTYPLTLAPDYCRDWSILDAIRELQQNLIDAGGGDIYYDEDEQKLYISNPDAQIPSKYLLMGGGSKSYGDGKLGQFGEGTKVAWLILTREGHEVEIQNGNVLWTPYYTYNELFGTDMLHIDEVPLEGNTSVTYTISNITQDDYDEVVDRCAFLRSDVEVLAETKYGNILTEPKGQLFVGGLYVCETDMEDYSYDIKPDHLKLNRDRQQPDNFDLKSMVRFMWQESDNKTEMVNLIVEKKHDAYLFNSSCHRDNEFEEACYDRAVDLYGEGVALADNDDDKELLYDEGYRNIKVTGNSAFNEVVKRSTSYRVNVLPEEEEIEELTPDEVLQHFYDKYYAEMGDDMESKFNNIMKLFEDKGVEWCYNSKCKRDELPF